MNFLRSLLCNLRQSVFSPSFLTMSLLASLCYFFSVLDELKFMWNSPSADVLYFFDYAQNIGYFTSMSVLCCTVINCTSFLKEYQSKYYRQCIIRSGNFAYTITKYLSCIITGGLIPAFGLVLFLLGLGMKFPMIADNSYYCELYINSSDSIFPGELLATGNHIGFYATYVLLVFIFGALWSGVGITVSAYITDKYVASFSPYILWFTSSMILDGKFRTEVVFKGNYSVGSFAGSLFFALGYFGAVIIVLAIVFCKKAGRRCEE